MPESDVTKMKVADLKRELKLRGLAVNGNKNELQDRLQAALLEGDISLDDSAIADAIDDDDVSLADEDEDKLLGEHDDDELLKSPVSTPIAAIVPDLLLDEHSDIKDGTSAAAALPAKKIVLKRNNSQLTSTTGGSTATSTIASKENGAPTASKDTQEDTPAKTKRIPIVIGGSKEGEKSADKKLTELTAEERLNLRAKKFGITPTLATASIATAINKSSSASIVANKGNKETDEKQKEALKRRAERFGCVVPEKTTKTLTDERLLKRKERFGVAAEASSTPATAPATPESKAIYSEKARARLERFKTAPAAAATK
ncbi:uncharacterized protein LOC117586630 [Drosophila guanche]|uniref:Blast:SAP domain-containing ribonucleoprotein n=1 Tax=Drosophila guanche TaxID=7266 RepID=A0A3B0KHG6_DROGU|nr:uncharacterized protein LOC117586630 [Drosophila guanche]SPP84551.1 blast:SAP domain-containing ribonucleoprotein [Drosophila guanche]